MYWMCDNSHTLTDVWYTAEKKMEMEIEQKMYKNENRYERIMCQRKQWNFKRREIVGDRVYNRTRTYTPRTHMQKRTNPILPHE